MNEYQKSKIAELKKLAWTEAGSRSYRGVRNVPIHIAQLTNSSQTLDAFVYPAEVLFFPI